MKNFYNHDLFLRHPNWPKNFCFKIFHSYPTQRIPQFHPLFGAGTRVRPQRRQPTRLPCPWDSPGKNARVGCHFLLQCMKVKSESEVAQSCSTPSNPMDCSLPGSSVHGIFQARVLEWGAIASPQDQKVDSHFLVYRTRPRGAGVVSFPFLHQKPWGNLWSS